MHVDGFSSPVAAMVHGVPLRSVLGPILFTMYTVPLSNIIESYNIFSHYYVDYLQLYVSCAPNVVEAIKLLKQCLVNVMNWLLISNLFLMSF